MQFASLEAVLSVCVCVGGGGGGGGVYFYPITCILFSIQKVSLYTKMLKLYLLVDSVWTKTLIIVLLSLIIQRHSTASNT